MAGLLDIAPLTESVTVAGRAVTVTGISAKGLASLLARFPELRSLVSGETLDAAILLAKACDAAGPIIAAGCGYPGNEDAEQKAGLIPLGEQANLLAAIFRLTMPGGFGPFVEMVAAALGGAIKIEEIAAEPQAIKLRAVTSR